MIKLNKKAFTIVELMISTVVFGVLLLLASMSIIGLTRQFYKGINQGKTQEAARNISEEISTNIQFSSQPPINLSSSDTGSWCVADQRYWFKLGQKLGNIPKVLIRDGACDQGVTTPTSDNELIPDNMRLIYLEVKTSNSGDVYSVVTVVGFGDDDLLCNETTAPGSCSSTGTLNTAQIAHPNTLCRGGAGSQYCAVSSSRVNVVRRIR